MALRKAYLTCVDAKRNCNKYYLITENDDHSCDVEYGRVGSTPQRKTYQSYEKSFDELFRTRLSHGYKDETNGHFISSAEVQFKEEEYEETQRELEHLYKISRQFTQKYYSNPSQITIKQWAEASNILHLIKKIYDDIAFKNLDEYAQDREVALNSYTINQYLIDIFTTTPRRMSRVEDYILNQGNCTLHTLGKIIDRETELLNNLEMVVKQPIQKENATISESFGIKMRPCTYKEEDEIKKLLHYKYEGTEAWKKKQYESDNSESMIRAYKVTNEKTQEAFKDCCKKMHIKDKDCKLLFHGSDGQNFLSIMSSGLKLNADRAGLAYTTGKGLGYGLYFADDSSKALNYSGGGTKYIALFNVAMGKPYETDVYFGDVGGMTVDGKRLGRNMGFKDLPYDTQSVFYKGGQGRGRHEICIYKQEQCDIEYLLVCEPYRRKDVRFSLRLEVPFKNLVKENEYYKADMVLSDYCKEQLAKIYPWKEIKTAYGLYDVKNDDFNIFINDRKPTLVPLTSDERERLSRDFKKSFFESEHDFKNDVKKYLEKPDKEIESNEEELER